ncbi:MAG: glycosyltransferase family 4 protein [Candidatus Dojkabacteria bacterium]|jgi:glycosyltransferase involved in cell wall biosynthesis
MLKKKKLLYLSQCFPLPLDGGGRIKTFNTLKTLSSKFDIFAVFVSERKATQKQLAEFKRLGIKVKIFKTKLMAESIKEDYLKLAWNYLQLRPHFVYQYRYKPSFSWIKNKIKDWQPNIIHVDHINSAQFLPKKNWLKRNCEKTPVLILENHNLDHVLFFTRFIETKKLIRKAYLLLEGSLNLLYGEINYRRFNHIFSISESETTYLNKKCKSVLVQPLVYPLKQVKTSQKKNYDILFIGYLEWPPNEVAVRWFIEKILPLVNQKMPEIKFHVIGNKNPRLEDLKANKNVIFYGHQKNIDHYLAKSKVFVLPFQTGAGVRLKSLTALQNGIPIVSTKMGVDGLKLTEQQHYLLAKTEKEFAQQVIKLLKNKELRKKISSAQKRYFLQNHSKKNNKLFLESYLKILKKFK